MEEDQLWLVEWIGNPDYYRTHNWSHVLVSIPDPHVGGKADEQSKSSTEEALASLQQKFDNWSTELTSHMEKLDKQSVELMSRLEKLEGLLERLLGAQGA